MTRNWADRAYIKPMNRRQFTASLGALSAAPLLPALPVAAASAPVLSPSAARIYPWAAQYARVHGQASAATLASVFKIAPQAAAEVSAQLLAKGVVTSSAGGALRAVQPVDWSSLRTLPRPQPQLAQKLKDGLDKLNEFSSDNTPVTEATGSESEPMPEDQSSDSAESPRA